MKQRVKKTLTDMASKRRERGKAPQTSEALATTTNPSAPATQADIAEVYEMVMQLLLRTTTPTPTPPPPPPMSNPILII